MTPWPPPPRRRGPFQADRPAGPRRGHPEATPATPPMPSPYARAGRKQPAPAPAGVGHPARRRTPGSGRGRPPGPSTACPERPNGESRRPASVLLTRYAVQPPPPTTPRTRRRLPSGGRHQHRHRARHQDCHPTNTEEISWPWVSVTTATSPTMPGRLRRRTVTPERRGGSVAELIQESTAPYACNHDLRVTLTTG
jgi:hypothetical protein